MDAGGTPRMFQRLIYRFYQQRLEHAVRHGQMPKHVGVVLDGNRRFARKSGRLSIAEGHRVGADRAEELESIFVLVEEKIDELGRAQSRSNRRRVRAVGRLELLPESTRASIARIEAETAGNGPYELIVAVGYGGREEITDAVKRMIAERLREGDSLEGIANSLEPDEIGRYMYAPDVPDPDLLIRTSGELRLSGFLLWQSAYSEYYFCDVYWPEFRKIDFLRAIRSYSQRQRRKGA